MQIESIVIVGGGTSGWMTAALLSKEHPEMEIALIESEKVPTIGVGESTISQFNRFTKRLELKDEDWMPYCNATYKTSIAFKNFREGKGERFQYPFGRFDSDSNIDFHDDIRRFFELQAAYGEEYYPPEQFARFNNKNTYTADYGRIPKGDIPGSNWDFADDTAYHFNADLFGNYLRDNIAVPNGVHHLKGDVLNVIKRPDGSIDQICTTQGATLGADIFIDCTGFRSLLLEQHMGSEFVSYAPMLFNDRALTTHIPYIDKEKQLVPYTDCVAMDCGWSYHIPLWNNIGSGYVYSSKYISDEDAEAEYRALLSDTYSPEIAQECQLMPIKIKHGKHKQAWVKNVIGIGLAFGFLEPLESTGLMTTHANILVLSEILSQRKGLSTKFDRDTYNFAADKIIESMKNFIAMHYALSSRQDTPYWVDCTETIEFDIPLCSNPKSTIMSLNDYITFIDQLEQDMYNTEVIGAGVCYIAAGMNIQPISPHLFKEKSSPDRDALIKEMHGMYQQERESMEKWIQTQPTHYQYLRDNIHVV